MSRLPEKPAVPTPIAPSNVFPFRGNHRLLHVGAIVGFLGIAAVTIALLSHLRDETETTLAANTRSLAQSLELMFVGQIDTIDVALLAASHEISRQLSGGRARQQDVNDYLGFLRAGLHNTEAIHATNERGDVIYGSDLASLSINVAFRDHFKLLRDHPDTGLVVINPLIAQTDKKWIWPFARRISKADGSFGGIVFARMDVADIERMLVQIKMDTSGIIALRDKDFGLIARYQFDGRNPVKTGDRKVSTQFLDAFRLHPEEGTYVVDGSKSIDQVSRTISYRRNPKFGYMVTVGIDRDIALAGWRAQAWAAGGLLLVLALVVFKTIRMIDRSWFLQEHEIDTQVRIAEQIRKLAFFDPLTQLPNRRLLNDRLTQSMAASKRSGNCGALLFLDLDNFKPLNDQHGHDVGDLLLLEVARRLKASVREMDTVSRFGGDEFVVLLSALESDKAGSILKARAIAEEIRVVLAQPYKLPVGHDDQADSTIEHRCTASIGGVVFSKLDDSQEIIIRHADAAMYLAKNGGSNSVVFYEDDA
jgi:diguanylate cyclase (GGDEF)-like protein